MNPPLQIAELKRRLEEEKARLIAIKDDHVKQHNMNKHQIQDLKQKLVASEVNFVLLINQCFRYCVCVQAEAKKLQSQLTSFETKFRVHTCTVYTHTTATMHAIIIVQYMFNQSVLSIGKDGTER